MLRIAIQAKGRLNEESIALLADAGITVSTSKRKLMARGQGFPIDVLYLRDDDIPQAVAMGVADIGIVGLNEVRERDERVDIVSGLNFGQCRLSIAVPKDADYQGHEWLSGRRIATSYPVILRKWLTEHAVDAEIHVIAGSVEVAPAVGMADAIFDIVSSGATLVQNGLVEVETALRSEAVLIANTHLADDQKVELDKLMFRFRSIVESRNMKYVLMNLRKESIDRAVAILPGMKSPTLLPLAEEGWYSMHVAIAGSELWQKIEQLKEIGAEDILVLSLDNIIR